MLSIELQTQHRITKSIDIRGAVSGPRLNRNVVRCTRLPRRFTRREMQQLMRVHDVAAVTIGRLMANLIARGVAHTATTCRFSSVCEKCRSESRSDNCVALSASAVRRLANSWRAAMAV